MDWLKKSREFFTNDKVLDEIGTILSLLLAIFVYVIAMGVIEGFDIDILLTWKSSVRVFGFFLSLEILQRNFTRKGDFHGHSEDTVEKIINDLITESDAVDDEKGILWCEENNQKERDSKRKQLRSKMKNNLLSKKNRILPKSNRYKDMNIKWYNIIKRRKKKKYNKKIIKIDRKIDDLDNLLINVSVDYITLEDLKYRGKGEHLSSRKRSKRYKEQSYKPVRRLMRTKNIIHAILLFGLNGAILGLSANLGEGLAYVMVMLLTFPTTALFAYSFTYKSVTEGSWFTDKKDQLKDLRKMNREIKENPSKYIEKEKVSD